MIVRALREVHPDGRLFLEEAVGSHAILRRQVLRFVDDVRPAPGCGTARVRIHEGRFLLEYDPAFVAEMLPSAADKRFVLMHEVEHLRRGDLMRTGRWFRRVPRLVNLAMDMYVNGSVLGSAYFRRALFRREVPQVLDRCYDPRTPPTCFLQPPARLLEAWSEPCGATPALLRVARNAVAEKRRRFQDAPEVSPAARGRLEAALTSVFEAMGFGQPGEAARLHLGGWTRTLPFSAFLPRLVRLFEREGLVEEVEATSLLLEHDADGLSALEKHWRRYRGKPGFSEMDHLEHIETEPTPRLGPEHQAFFAALRAALIADPAHTRHRPDVEGMFPSVLLHVGRKEAALLAGGIPPVLCQAPGRAPGTDNYRVQLYLDVSGSMMDRLGFLYGLTLAAGDRIGAPVFGFSNKVVPMDRGMLEAGEVETTGGTDLDCVAAHARASRYRRILVLTDGWFACSDKSRRFLKHGVDTFMVVAGGRGTPARRVVEKVEQVAQKWWTLPPVR